MTDPYHGVIEEAFESFGSFLKRVLIAWNKTQPLTTLECLNCGHRYDSNLKQWRNCPECGRNVVPGGQFTELNVTSLSQFMNPIKSHMKYYDGMIKVIPTLYASNGNSALIFVDPDSGETIANATLNLEASLLPHYIIIKDYSENEGVLDTLVNGKIVELTGVIQPTGFAKGYEAIIINHELLQEIDKLHERINAQ